MQNINIYKTPLEEILPFRKQFLQEINCQIRYESCHTRHWADEYLLVLDDLNVGYGSIKGKEALADRDAVFEFYVVPNYRKYTNQLFVALLKKSQATYIECQSNDFNLSALLYEFGHQIYSDTILFEDHLTTNFKKEAIIFRKRQTGDDVMGKSAADEGEYVLEKAGKIIADGGFLLHYNKPFADLYMETAKEYRNQGLSSFILQELKKACYEAGRVPAARCHIENTASKATLLKAGMRISGYMLIGEVKTGRLS